ncbi:HAD-IC family P-type ATPase [Thermosynechococcus sp. QS41]|uniref:HAD-IC family P-type ATPase n=1 Tax=Thermosynechococcus sp. QS41 TaxID=3074101 RepID=UPI00287778EF|nr:HAD-IC family P-type ATPase [Thermosynechococcus sp. QS41]WNC60656.1 HAD-IC family P-type ATPase [Thermosynechococcus sp. QS41]
MTAPLTGLTAAEVAERQARGRINRQASESNRTYGDILRENLFTFINGVFAFISVILLFLGRPGDVAAIIVVVFLNAIISILQEIRAKRQLDEISLLTRPRVKVLRDRQEAIIDPAEVVEGDILLLEPGDQIVADGTVVGDGQIQVDESLLTGESDLISKQAGDRLYSGSFCVRGAAAYVAEQVGEASTAHQLTAAAKTYHHKLTPLQREINLIIRVILALAIFLWLLVLLSLLVRLTTLQMSVQTAAVVAGLVPVGLYLTITLTYALGALRISRANVLVQQVNAIESLSGVDILCLDKTGTLTANALELHSWYALTETEEKTKAALATFTASVSAPNRTLVALTEAFDGRPQPLRLEIPFSSAYKWSAAAWQDSETFILGAPDVLFKAEDLSPEVTELLQRGRQQGLRVLLFARSCSDPQWDERQETALLPPDLEPLAVIWVGDRLRPQSREVLERFQQAGIQIKIISGDHAETVVALAKQVGLDDGAIAISGTELAAMDDPSFDQMAEKATVFGRITPEQKAKLVTRLRALGHQVAMIGDGVNDVLSLKQANVGIAMESGSAITRNVADIVLLADSFAALPAAFREGQRIYNGIQDVTKLFLVRVFSFSLLCLVTVMAGRAFPLLIKHNSLLTLWGVGLPTLAVAFWAVPGPRPHRSLIRSLLHFVIPATLSLALLAIFMYLGVLARELTPLVELLQGRFDPTLLNGREVLLELGQSVAIARTALVTTLMLASLCLVLFLKPPHPIWVGGAPLVGNWRYVAVVLALLAAFLIISFSPTLRAVAELEPLSWSLWALIVLIVLLWVVVLRAFWRYRLLDRFLGVDLS